MKNDSPFKCNYCGKFISFKDFEDLSAQLTFKWGFQEEENAEYFHVKCKEQYEIS